MQTVPFIIDATGYGGGMRVADNDRDFWIRLMEKLASENDTGTLHIGVLRDLCEYLNYGACFVYVAEYGPLFQLQESYSIYTPAKIPEKLDLTAVLGEEDFARVSAEKMLAFRKNTPKNTLHGKLSVLFEALSMVLVPVVDKAQKMIALVGVLDRRGTARENDADIQFIYSVLITLANHIKMQLLQNRVEDTRRALDSTINNTGVDVYVNDFHTHEILYVNKSMAAPYGGVQNMMGRRCWEALYEDKTGECDFCPQKRIVDDDGNPTKVYSWDYQRPFDGAWFRVLSAAFPWVDGRLSHVVSSIDISEQKKNEDTIRRMAEYDHLTGLPNRFRMNADCDDMVARGNEGYLVFFDLDGFKAVNDSLGHDVGDKLLTAVGRRLQHSEHTHDHSYRFGGDEFIVLVDSGGEEAIKNTLAELQQIFAQPWDIGTDMPVRLGASIGVSCYPEDSKKASGLLRMADQAMYTTKYGHAAPVHFYNNGSICTMDEYFSSKRPVACGVGE